jgi:biotin operon repressor
MPRQTKLSLVPDASMYGVEPSGFYQTPNHMAMKAIQAKLTSADWCVWSYLQMIDPFGDRFVDIPNHREIAEIIGLSEKSVKRSIHKLEELGFYDTQVLVMKGKNLAGKAVRDDRQPADKVVQQRTKLSNSGQSCPATDKVVQQRTKLSKSAARTFTQQWF